MDIGVPKAGATLIRAHTVTAPTPVGTAPTSCKKKKKKKKKNSKSPKDPEEGAVHIPETAMVVFGSKDHGSVQSLLSRLRT